VDGGERGTIPTVREKEAEGQEIGGSLLAGELVLISVWQLEKSPKEMKDCGRKKKNPAEQSRKSQPGALEDKISRILRSQGVFGGVCLFGCGGGVCGGVVFWEKLCWRYSPKNHGRTERVHWTGGTPRVSCDKSRKKKPPGLQLCAGK